MEITRPCCRYKTEPVLASAQQTLYWDRSTVTDKTVDCNRPDAVFIDRQHKTALVIDIAVPFTYNLPKMEEEKVTKYENMVLVIKNNRKLNNVSINPSVISAEGEVTRNFLKYLQNIVVTENI